MFKKIREIARKGPLPVSRGIRSSSGRILWEPEDIAKPWEEYIASLFHDDREDDVYKTTSYESGPSILKEEVRWALQHCKPGKAAGPDEVVVEMLIVLQEDGVDVLWSLFKNVYETGQIPTEMLKSVFIAVPKKSNTLDCENHITISLMAHTLKLFLKIILRHIRRKILPQIPTYQYGFMPDRGTRNAIFVLRMLCERSIEHQMTLTRRACDSDSRKITRADHWITRYKNAAIYIAFNTSTTYMLPRSWWKSSISWKIFLW